MLSRDKAMRYRMNALRCGEIADHISNPENRLSILGMSRAWHALAEQYEQAEPIALPRRTEDELLSEVDWY